MVSNQTVKLDIIISPLIPDEMPAEIPFISDVKAARDTVQKAGIKVLEMTPEVNRIAVGEEWSFPVANKEAGYVGLGHFLPNVDIDPFESRDFLYRINRPRLFGEMWINRLSTWACKSDLLLTSPVRRTHRR
jgi:hypothetical protein